MAVVRPEEVEDDVGGEFGHLFGRAAVNRLIPDVRDAVRIINIAYSAPVRRPPQSCPVAERQGHVKRFDGVASVERHQPDGRMLAALLFSIEVGDELPVGRDHGYVTVHVIQLDGRASVNRNLPDSILAGPLRIEDHPATVWRERWRLITRRPFGQLLRVAAVRIYAPDVPVA